MKEVKTLSGSADFKKAIILLKKKLETSETLQKKEHIECLNELSSCLWKSGQYIDAITHAQEALKLARKEPKDLLGYARQNLFCHLKTFLENYKVNSLTSSLSPPYQLRSIRHQNTA